MTTAPTRLPIRTQHCRFCNHLLLATTRDLSTLPRRAGDAKDKAVILPLSTPTAQPDTDTNTAIESGTDTAGTATTSPKHATLLLSTTIPDRRATLIRREDGIEKRVLLRCGRCRVVVGYYLDKVHWASGERRGNGEEGGDGGDGEERPPAVYVLPGAVVDTDQMGEEGGGVGEREWKQWNNEA